MKLFGRWENMKHALLCFLGMNPSPGEKEVPFSDYKEDKAGKKLTEQMKVTRKWRETPFITIIQKIKKIKWDFNMYML